MKVFRSLILYIVSALVLSGCTLPFSEQKAGLQVTANPQSNVFLDGKPLGQTPVYQENLKPGSYTVKVISSDSTLTPWEGKVTLNPGVLTVVDRQLSPDQTKTHGYTLTFEKLPGKNQQEVNVTSFPDTVSVSVDGAPMGFTPFKSDSVIPGPHTFTLTSPGYQDKVIKATVTAGHRLLINAQLGVEVVVPTPTPSLEPTPTATISATPTKAPTVKVSPTPKSSTSSALVAKPYIEVLSTPTGFLRVRAEDNASSNELAKVNPGEKYPYVAKSGSWYKIEYAPSSYGWVSSTYARLVE